VTFLPGAMLTLGMVELAYGDMVSGSSRLITGLVQLVLLAFGLAAGATLAGYTPYDLLAPIPADSKLDWVPWAGVVVFGVGVYLHFSAPSKAFWWMLLVLFAAFVAQRVATPFVGSGISGFFGTLVATPLGYLIQLKFKGPAFDGHVPAEPAGGQARSASSAYRMLSDHVAGIEGIIAAIFAVTSIALATGRGVDLQGPHREIRLVATADRPRVALRPQERQALTPRHPGRSGRPPAPTARSAFAAGPRSPPARSSQGCAACRWSRKSARRRPSVRGFR
jgi:uncharacterized membrane protein YjjB (DUF3815 family)